MPFKCVQCDTVVQSMDQAECKCPNPFFVKCVTIHLLHPEGPGELFAKSSSNQGAKVDDAGVSKPLAVRNYQALKLGCNISKLDMKRNLVTASIMESLVTCPDCLAFLNQLKTRSNTECQSSEDRTMEPITH